jgi:hypothetical protein
MNKGSTDMGVQEKRSFERIPHDDLPHIFKTLLIDIGDHRNLHAETVDISTSGIGVYLSVPPDFVYGTDQIVLHSSDNRYKFAGQIVNVKKLKNDQFRLGVVFESL